MSTVEIDRTFFMRHSLIVFARAPAPGQTKTRLARSIGDDAAALLASAMLHDTLDTAQKWAHSHHDVSVAFSPSDAFTPGACSLRALWDGTHFAQCAGDIGARMLAAIEHQQSRGFERVLIIGSDFPDITVEILDAACDALTKHELVFGPAHDGGFYLIGAAHLLSPDFFDNIEWSSPRVLEQTLTKARHYQFTYSLGALHRDVDEFDDLLVLRERLRSSQHAPHTRQALSQIEPLLQSRE
jgi:rSAM/selenodomain-associated transferase 1